MGSWVPLGMFFAVDHHHYPPTCLTVHRPGHNVQRSSRHMDSQDNGGLARSILQAQRAQHG
jgi:hypothetical protein